MNIGTLQINPVVGDMEGNAALIIAAAREAAAKGADMCIASELAVCGYPPRDMLLYKAFVRQAMEAAAHIARELKDGPPLLVGCPEPCGDECARAAYNSALWLEGGEIRQTFKKSLLPTYDVFDEARYFEPAPAHDGSDSILHFMGKKIAVTICEDVWNDKDFWPSRRYQRDPLELAATHQPDLIVNLSASPFSIGKQALRERMLAAEAAKYGVPLVYVNQWGGNDDLVFDGRSCAVDAAGELVHRSGGFCDAVDMVVWDETVSGSLAEDEFERSAEIWNALVLGVRDYVRKSGFKTVLLGLSGGIDSAVTAVIAAEALGAENVLGVLMPSPWSSKGSIDDSLALAQANQIRTLTLPIEPAMQSMEQTLAEPFEGFEQDTTEENIQSRIRGNLLMALSNKFRSLLLTTGNKSELAVGYCTIYGDMSGGFAVISDVPKVDVFELCRWINRTKGELIPDQIITKPPSAELRPDQKDEDSLPPYEILDAILEMHVEQHLTGDEIVDRGFERETVDQVLRLVTYAEFKRRQAAPGIKLTPRSFGTGWRMPLACKRPL